MCHKAGKSHAEHHNPVLVGWVGSVLGLAFGWLMLCSLRSGGPTTIPATGWPKPSAQWARGVASRALCHPHSQPVGAWVHCWGPDLVGNTQGAQQGGTESGPQGLFPGARLHRARSTTCGLAASPPWLGAKTGLSQGAHHQQGASNRVPCKTSWFGRMKIQLFMFGSSVMS